MKRKTARALGTACLALLVAASGCGSGDLDERTAEAAEAAGVSASGSSAGDPAATPPAIGPDGGIDLDMLGFAHGDPNAPIRVIEFSDFGCGYCRQFHMESYPAVVRDYVDTGIIYWQYIPYVLGIFPHGLEGALAGECAGEQGMLEPFGARMFKDQAEWKNHEGTVGEIFTRYAHEEGLDAARFQQCLVEDWRRDHVRANVIAGGQLGVRGTPTFYIPGYQPVSGALPPEAFQQIVEFVLAEQAKESEAGSSP